MKKSILFILIIISTAVSCKKHEKINTLTNEEEEAGWQLLFNGKSTDNWRMFKGGQVNGWKIGNGILCNSGVGSDHGGDIITKDTFKNFELSLEWKIDSASNSGIFYHVQELDSIKAIYESGPEYQLLDDSGFEEELHPDQYSGANYGMHTPEGAKVKPLGQWNQTRILVNGAHVEHWLNGVKVVEYEWGGQDWKKRKNKGKWKDYPYYGTAGQGHIGLQDHGGLTCFRNIKIRKL